jgi:nucleotidyltransferase substrate binding protein (TIGR01987 family)
MEQLMFRYKALTNALKSLSTMLSLLNKAEDEKNKNKFLDPFNHEEITKGLRDSLIKRFEYTNEMLWKYMKTYLEKVVKKTPKIIGPRSIARAACNAKLITEQQAQKAIDMIDYRNLTSHIYKEEIAIKIRNVIPEYYKLIKAIIDKLKP